MDLTVAASLSFQIVLALLGPGIPIAGVTLFPADVWSVCVLGLIVTRLGPRNVPWKLLGTVLAIFLVALLHGAVRPHIPVDMARQLEYESDQFSLAHETVRMIRFLLWLAEGACLWKFLGAISEERRRHLRGFTNTALALTALLAGTLTALTGVSRHFLIVMSRIYGYEESLQVSMAKTWGDRAFGTFQSPLDAGVSLSFCLFVLIAISETPGRVIRFLSGGVCAIATLFTGTATAMLSAVAAWGLSWYCRSSKTVKSVIVLALSAGVAFVALRFEQIVENHAIGIKYGHLIGRMLPWKLFWADMTSRIDVLLLGFGFTSQYVDNSYLFVFFKLGLIGSAILFYGMIRWGARNWSSWSPRQREIIYFLLFSAVTLDTLILRSVVLVFIAAGIPVLWVNPNRR